jgi:hypothetical protein
MCTNHKTDEFIRKFSWLSTRKFINEYIYWHGAGKISSFLKRLLQGILVCAPTIKLMNLSENSRGCQQENSSMNVFIGIKQVKSPVS